MTFQTGKSGNPSGRPKGTGTRQQVFSTDDGQSMLSLNVVTGKGLSTPLLWKSVDKTQLKHNCARYEDQLLSRLKEVLPEGVEVTLLADRGFADQKFFRFLDEELNFKYIIRIKSSTTVISNEYGR